MIQEIQVNQNFATYARDLFFRLVSLEEVDKILLDEDSHSVTIYGQASLTLAKIKHALIKLKLPQDTIVLV